MRELKEIERSKKEASEIGRVNREVSKIESGGERMNICCIHCISKTIDIEYKYR